MFCSHCGAPIREDSRFCPECGTQITGEAARPQEQEESLPVTQRITLFPDRKYRWTRPADLLKNASQLKFVLLCTGFTSFIFSLLICWGSELTELGLWECLKLILIVTGGGILAALICYVLVAQAIGRRFSYLYEMDKEALLISRRLKKSQDLRWSIAGYAMGLASDPVFAMDLFNLMTDNSCRLSLSGVRSAQWEEGRQAIKLKGSFGSRRIYIDPMDLPAFTAHLRRFCPRLNTIR